MEFSGAALGLYFIFMIGIIVSYVFTIIAIWKLSKAHQSLAETVKVIAENIKPKQE
ncbi:hypothetical protein [Dehalobacter sp. 4CP]|uniref:hypothetical protein n=1 Tax=Dehalobacter sp. CP TaxID=2594474 RepID=UPI0039ED9732|nr:hypothetical protein [Dehalobacter sp.]